ncbi:MAG: hypothetical protein M3Y28_08050 [Armatimonadota bacterium]|nr:hypothetical protein [Armatimonadota bacterium]
MEFLEPPAGVTSSEYEEIVARCQNLPKAKGNYIINDYVENVLLTVLDFQMRTTTVERAANYYQKNVKQTVNTHQELKQLLAGQPDTKAGNQEIAQYLWGYRLWTRVALLRRLLHYLESENVTTQEQLKTWANKTTFADFQGKVKGAGFAIFKWLIMRQGVETIKPDVWVHRFIAQAISRSVSNETAVVVLEQAAKNLDIPAYELDWRIWEYQRDLPQT